MKNAQVAFVGYIKLNGAGLRKVAHQYRLGKTALENRTRETSVDRPGSEREGSPYEKEHEMLRM